MKFCLIALLSLLLSKDLSAQKLIQIAWHTKHAAEMPQLSPEQQKMLPIVRMGLAAMPESALISMSGLGASMLGMPEVDSARLQKLLIAYYAKLEADPVFKGQPSALPYCFSATKPTLGRASVYLPKGVTNETPTILFLHGFGGSFQYYQHIMAKTFPNHIVICPAFGISMGNVNSIYLDECLRASRKASGLANASAKPILIGISAGALGSFHELARRPDKYQSFICIAGYPPITVRYTGPIRILAGSKEVFVKDGTLTRNLVGLRRTAPNSLAKIITGGDHFFLVTHEAESRRILQNWINKSQ